MKFELKGMRQFETRLNQIVRNITKTDGMLDRAGKVMQSSIVKNFQEGGRPQKWTPLKPQTLKSRRRRHGKVLNASGNRRTGGRKILIDTRWLMSSVRYIVKSSQLVAAGTSVVYAKRHQFGYPGGAGRGHSSTPARSFVMFQDEDKTKINEIFVKQVTKK